MWILVAVAILLFIYTIRESFTDTEFTNVTRPSLEDGAWKSKIDAQVPIGSNDADYIKALQAFYDNVYKPAEVKPTISPQTSEVSSKESEGVLPDGKTPNNEDKQG